MFMMHALFIYLFERGGGGGVGHGNGGVPSELTYQLWTVSPACFPLELLINGVMKVNSLTKDRNKKFQTVHFFQQQHLNSYGSREKHKIRSILPVWVDYCPTSNTKD